MCRNLKAIETINNLPLDNLEVEHDYYYILGSAYTCRDPADETVVIGPLEKGGKRSEEEEAGGGNEREEGRRKGKHDNGLKYEAKSELHK